MKGVAYGLPQLEKMPGVRVDMSSCLLLSDLISTDILSEGVVLTPLPNPVMDCIME